MLFRSNAHIQPDMIIKRVSDQDVTKPAEFYRAMDKVRGPVELVFSNLKDMDEQRITIDNK